MTVEFKIKRIDDKSLYKLFEKAKKAGESELESASNQEGVLQGGTHRVDLNFSSALPWKISEKDIRSAPAGQFVIDRATITFDWEGDSTRGEQVSFRLQRGGNDALVDKFSLEHSNTNTAMNSDGAQSVQKAIHKALSPLLKPVAPEDGGLIPTLSNLAEAFSTTYQGITAELSDAVAAVSNERSEQLTEFQDERRRLRNEIAEEKAAMHKEMQQELDVSRAEIANDRKKIDEEWGKLEVSSHKDARRKQFQRLQEDLQNALQEPVADRGLRQTRWAVFWALVVAAFAAGYFAYLSISFPPTTAETTASWLFPAIRTMILTFASLASFVGAAAWLRYFYVRDLTAQEETRRFRNDMARASWVMDAALEIRKEHDETIPTEWITGVTEGLFSARKRDTLEEGAQALAALMGLSASTSFGPNGTTVEIGKKGGKVMSAAAKDHE
jgi:hypothetical protein